ncbi:hypothetical protein DCW30_29365 [Streptomyces alfalfae]|nr:hypothetical protein D3X13_14085 [Streptomyces fradiae]RXX37479.1 hypothetical protein DCW30_29365 [Streptomyces alfalfae]RZM99386.1 hypothetical protein D4104_10330 [Streptomyces alfalfae]
MSASERDVEPRPRPRGLPVGAVRPGGLSMSDLLASCAAASAVSTPPASPAATGGVATERRRPSC